MKTGVQLEASRTHASSRSPSSPGRPLGIPNYEWDDDLDRRLREAWDHGGASAAVAALCGARPLVSRAAVRRRARKLGLAPPRRRWSADDTNLLLHAIGGESSIAMIAKILGRTEDSVRSKLRQLEYSIDDFDGYRPKQLANWFDLSVRQVRYWVERGYLETRNHRITEESLRAFLRERPESIPFDRLSEGMQRWLRDMGYQRATVNYDSSAVGRTDRKPASTARRTESGAA